MCEVETSRQGKLVQGQAKAQNQEGKDPDIRREKPQGKFADARTKEAYEKCKSKKQEQNLFMTCGQVRGSSDGMGVFP